MVVITPSFINKDDALQLIEESPLLIIYLLAQALHHEDEQIAVINNHIRDSGVECGIVNPAKLWVKGPNVCGVLV